MRALFRKGTVTVMTTQRETVCRLLDCYGQALSERCRDVLEWYYADDLSLAEIAENCSITRQGVHDALRRGETELLALERALGFAEKTDKLLSIAERLSAGSEREKQIAAELVTVLAAAAEGGN